MREDDTNFEEIRKQISAYSGPRGDIGMAFAKMLDSQPKNKATSSNAPSSVMQKKSVTIAGIYDSGLIMARKNIPFDTLTDFTSGYFAMRESGGFIWEKPIKGFDEYLAAYELCLNRVKPLKTSGKKNVLIISNSP